MTNVWKCLEPAVRNFGKQIVSDEGYLVGFPKAHKWQDVLAAVPRWFQKVGGSGGEAASKVYLHYQSVAPTQERGSKKFLTWIRDVCGIMTSPLPLEN